MRAQLITLDGHHCPCGAVAEDNATACRKCRSRAMWRRRQDANHRHAKRYRHASRKHSGRR